MYIELLSVIFPIISIALLGYYWSYKKHPYNSQFIAKLVMEFGTPCLILSSVINAGLPPEKLFLVGKITAAGLLLLFAINAIVLKVVKSSYKTYLSSLSFANTGNMGAPICLFAFGEQGLVLALTFFMVTSIFHFSIGISLVGGDHPVANLIKSPVFYAAILAVVFSLTGFTFPVAIMNTLTLLGGVAIPLMLFSLGVSLQSLKVQSLSSSFFYALVRLLGGLAVGFLLCWLFELEGVLRGVVLIQSAMPSAVFNYLLAENYGRKPEKIAGVVVISTLISFLTLPLLLVYIFNSTQLT